MGLGGGGKDGCNRYRGSPCMSISANRAASREDYAGYSTCSSESAAKRSRQSATSLAILPTTRTPSSRSLSSHYNAMAAVAREESSSSHTSEQGLVNA